MISFKERILDSYKEKSKETLSIKYLFEHGYIFAGDYYALSFDEDFHSSRDLGGTPSTGHIYEHGDSECLNRIDVDGKFLENVAKRIDSTVYNMDWDDGDHSSYREHKIQGDKRFLVAFERAISSDEYFNTIKKEGINYYNSLLCSGKRGNDLIASFTQKGDDVFRSHLTDQDLDLFKTIFPNRKNFFTEEYKILNDAFLEQSENGDINEEFMKRYLGSRAAEYLFSKYTYPYDGESGRNKDVEGKLKKIVLKFIKDNKDLNEAKQFLESIYGNEKNFFTYLINGDNAGFYKFMEEETIKRINADKINAMDKHYSSTEFLEKNYNLLENHEENKKLINHLRKNDIIEYVVKDIRLGGKEYGNDAKLNCETYEDVKKYEKEHRIKAFGKDLSEEWLNAENRTTEFDIIKKAIVNSNDKDECIKNIYPYFRSKLCRDPAEDIDMYLFMHKESVEKEKFFETIYETFYLGDYDKYLKENKNVFLKTKNLVEDLIASSAFAELRQGYIDKYMPLYAETSENNDRVAKIKQLKKAVKKDPLVVPEKIDAMSAEDRKELFNISKKAIEETPQLTEVAISNMMNVYVATEDRKEQKAYLLDLYTLRKSGKTDKDKREMAKTFNRVITRDERLQGDKNLANLAKIDTIFSQPTKFVRNEIERR